MIGAAASDHVDIQGLCITGTLPLTGQHSGELTPSLTAGSTREGKACISPGQRSKADPGGREQQSQPWGKAESTRELTLPLLCPEVAACRCPSSPMAVRRAGPALRQPQH